MIKPLNNGGTKTKVCKINVRIFLFLDKLHPTYPHRCHKPTTLHPLRGRFHWGVTIGAGYGGGCVGSSTQRRCKAPSPGRSGKSQPGSEMCRANHMSHHSLWVGDRPQYHSQFTKTEATAHAIADSHELCPLTKNNKMNKHPPVRHKKIHAKSWEIRIWATAILLTLTVAYVHGMSRRC